MAKSLSDLNKTYLVNEANSPATFLELWSSSIESMYHLTESGLSVPKYSQVTLAVASPEYVLASTSVRAVDKLYKNKFYKNKFLEICVIYKRYVY